MTGIFDTHAHYDSERFNNDRDELLKTLPDSGIVCVVNCASDFHSSEFSLSLADKYNYIYAAVGVHPHEAQEAGEFDESRLTSLASHKKAVAIGEIGLDYHYDFSPRNIQLEWFEKQVILANKLDLPVVVHDREAHADTMDILRKHRPKGVVHCFSGSVEMAKEVLSLGMFIGLGGSVTFKNARVPVEVAAYVPTDRFVLETDCPYMTPVPHRGERCDSCHISFTAAKIAEIKNLPVEEILSAGIKNGCALYNITF